MYDFAIGFFRVVATTVSNAAKAVLETLDAGGVGSGDKEHWPEGALGQPSFGQVGLVVRPRGPTKDGQAERIALDSGDGLIPFAGRDLRLNRFYPSPKDGAVALVGYAGAFDSNEPSFDGAGKPASSVRTIYVPYAFVNGVPTKAHMINIDSTPNNESIQLIHGEGQSFELTKDKKIVASIDGSTFLEFGPGKFVVNAAVIQLVGNVAVGGNPATAVPFTGGPAMPPSTTFFYSSPA